ncbi:MAG TPA: SRPBCC domain-containing protein [Allosphingosinicella sp.]
MTRRFEAPAEAVFDAWLDEGSAGEWLFATPAGETVRVDIDPRVGGRYEIVERRDGEDVLHTGAYEEIDRPRRLAFTLQVPKYAPNSDRVRIAIAAAEDGGSELTLCQTVSAGAPASPEQIERGWGLVLAGLARRMERQEQEG